MASFRHIVNVYAYGFLDSTRLDPTSYTVFGFTIAVEVIVAVAVAVAVADPDAALVHLVSLCQPIAKQVKLHTFPSLSLSLSQYAISFAYFTAVTVPLPLSLTLSL